MHAMRQFQRRLYGLALRQVYLIIGSWPRLIEMIYWPMINMLVWGFTSLYIVREVTHTKVFAGVFIGGVLLTEVILRVCTGIMIFFLEEIWSRNFGHLFASPIRFSEYTISLFAMSLVRMSIGVVPAIFVAKYMFGFSLFSLGWPLIGLIALLMFTGWWYGMLLISILLRFGLAAEWVAWMSTWLLVPFMAPYYPVEVLPAWTQAISWALPPTYVFEVAKELIGGTAVHFDYLWRSLLLNGLYFFVASVIFRRAYIGARRRGGLLQVGE